MTNRILTSALVLLGLLGCTLSASAKPEFLKTLAATYPLHAASIQQRSCTNCHVAPGNFSRNPYGKDLEKLMQQAGVTELTPAVIKQAENDRPAPTSATFGALINADKAPGVPAQVAGGASAAAASSSSASSAASTTPAPSSIIPDNAFHPAIVHFPIALFLTSVFLDALGFIRKDKTMLLAGWYNLALAAISSLAAVATGLTAFFIMKLPFQGIIRTHMILALLSTVMMWAMFGLRVFKHENISAPSRIAYYVLMVINVVVISITGHLGGEFVYGS